MSDQIRTPEEAAMAEAAGLTEQPLPVANSLPSAHDMVSEDLREASESWIPWTPERAYEHLLDIYIGLHGGDRNAAIQEIQKRKEFGLAKYDTLLQPFNGRDALADAIDEMGDLLVYTRVKVYEDRNPRTG